MCEAFVEKFGTYAVSAAGFVGNEAPFVNYLPEFYQDAYPFFIQQEDGTWVDGFLEENMKDALQRIQDAVAAGIIDKETLTNKTSDARNKFYDDKFGVFTYWAGTWRCRINYSSSFLPASVSAEITSFRVSLLREVKNTISPPSRPTPHSARPRPTLSRNSSTSPASQSTDMTMSSISLGIGILLVSFMGFSFLLPEQLVRVASPHAGRAGGHLFDLVFDLP